MMQSGIIKGYVDAYYASHDEQYLKLLRTFLIEKDYLASTDTDYDLTACKRMGKQIIKYRQFETDEGSDGLDGVRHNLRMLRQVNLPDTRLIICSMEGDRNYPEIDQLMASPEYSDMVGKVVITAEPNYLAQFSSANQVVSYNRRFMNAAKGMK